MKDYIVRGNTKDGFIRFFGADTKEIVNTAHNMHKTYPVATAAIGRLLTAASMMGAMLKSEDDIITLQMSGGGPLGKVVAVADCNANVKGYVGNPFLDIPLNKNGKLDVGGAIGTDGSLIVIRDFGLKEPYIGKTPLVSGEIGDDLTSYFAVSEQVPSVVGLGVLVDRDYSAKCAGGFIIQVMPGATDEAITKLEENIKKVKSVTELLDSGKTIEDVIADVLEGFELDFNEKKDTKYYCNCSKERVEKVLITLGEKELTDIIEQDKKAELSCHFCEKVYNFDEEELRKLLKSAKENA